MAKLKTPQIENNKYVSVTIYNDFCTVCECADKNVRT